MKVWLSGRIVDSERAKVSVFDRGFLYGDGVFESLRSYNGKPFRLDEHLSRLKRSLGIIGIKTPYSKRVFRDSITRLLKKNGLKDAYIRISLTRGQGRFALGESNKFSPTVVIFAKPFKPYPKKIYERGISAKVVKIRSNELSPISRIKPMSFLNNILARQEAYDNGCDEAILMNTRGEIAEAATSNVFLVCGQRLITPSIESGVLAGVTRKIILRLSGAVSLEGEEASIRYNKLIKADEVFLTNSLFEVLPVVAIDKHKVAGGAPGPKTMALAAKYKELTNSI